MRQRVIPLLAAQTKERPTAGSCVETRARGLAALNSPWLNKGKAFPAEERAAPGVTAPHDRDEELFSEHLREMIPAVTDLTVRLAVDPHHRECRSPRGVCFSIDRPGMIERAFSNPRAGGAELDLTPATGAEQIPEIGDGGIGGIEVSIGKLAIRPAAGGTGGPGGSPVRRHRAGGTGSDVATRVSPDPCGVN